MKSERDELVEALLARIEEQQRDLELLRRIGAQVLAIRSLLPGQELADPIEHAITQAAQDMRHARDRAIAERDERRWYLQEVICRELGGLVEGSPTHSGNLLQRIRELRGIEVQRDELRARLAGLGIDSTAGGDEEGLG